MEDPITGMKIVEGSTDPGSSWNTISNDLNEGAGGKYLYLCYTKAPKYGDPITDVVVISGESSDIQPPDGYERIDVDTNAGAHGYYVFVCYAREDDVTPITDLVVTSGDEYGIPCPHGYFKVDVDLNAGAGGKYIFICCKK